MKTGALIVSALASLALAREAAAADVPLWGRFETQVTNARTYANPFKDVVLNAAFTSPSGRKVNFFGFHDGDGNGGQSGTVWKLRFMPDELGTWSFTCSFSDGAAGTSGSFNCVSAGAQPGPLRKDAANPAVLRFANGARFYPRCYYLSESFTAASPGWESNIDKFFGGTWKYNLNCTIFWQGRLLQQNGWNALPYNGFYPTVNGDYTKLSVAGWKHVDAVLQRMQARGAVWYNFDGFVPNVGGDMGAQRTDFAAQQVYARNVVARIGPYWNVIWTIAFEWAEFMTAAQVAQLADYVKSIDPWNHLVAVHDQGSATSGSGVVTNLHTDFPVLQYAAGRVPSAAAANSAVRSFSGSWPVFGQEMAWEDSAKLNGDQVRRGTWGIHLAGGFTCYAEMFDKNYGNGAAFPYLEILFNFLGSLPYWEMSSRNDLVDSGKLCFAKPASRYVCYAESGGTIGLNLSGVSGTFQAEWVNPRTGTRTAAGTVSGGGTRSFATPDASDWALHVVATTASNSPPAVSITSPASGATFVAPATISIAATASDSDGTVAKVEFFQGTTLLGTDTSAPYGITWSGVPAGSYSLTARATDNAGATATSAAVAITVAGSTANTAPTANSQSVSTAPDTPVSFQLSYSDPDGPGPYTFTVLSGPSNGTLRDDGGNDRTYTPKAGFAGTDSFTWKVNDGKADSNTATVTIAVSSALSITNTAPSRYLWDTLDAGKVQYIDRTYTFSSVPPAFVGLKYLRTANDDKGSTGSSWVGFDVDQNVTVYVAHDDRFATRPSWMSGWTDTGANLVSGGGTFSLFAKDFPAGRVTLGGNTSDGVAQNSMYTVVVKGSGGSSPPPFSVKIDFVSTGKAYSLAPAQAGGLYYIDRSYTIGTLSIANAQMIRTANDDKYATASTHLQFTVSGSAAIYVAYDRRATKNPAWLNDGTWTATSETVAVSDTGASPMRVFRKPVGAGQVTLGGNHAGGATGAHSNYFVLIQGGSGAAARALAADVWEHPGDADGDGLLDDFEQANFLDPANSDSDGDGLPDESELSASGRTHWEEQGAGSAPEPGGGGDACGLLGLEALLLLALLARARIRAV